MKISFKPILLTVITLTLCLFGRGATPQEAAGLDAEIARGGLAGEAVRTGDLGT